MNTLTSEEILYLEEKAKEIRISILKMITKAKSGHTGGSLSIADLVTLLYFKEMNIFPNDRLVLSKGHAAPAVYAALAKRFF